MRFTKRPQINTAKLVKKAGDKALVLQSNSTKHVDKYLKKRVKRIVGVRRFMVGWLFLVIFLCATTFAGYLQIKHGQQVNVPASGGTYTEGSLGSINNLNPLFSSGVVDDSAARLMFSSLLVHDQEGKLIPDLAESFKVGKDSQSYDVKIRKSVQWQDGRPLTADDVVYTIRTIQNPETRSTLFASWQGVKVRALNQYTVRFELPAPFAPFLEALTVPILPKHLLSEIKPSRLRTTGFNTSPVGSGPFVFQALRNDGKEQQIEMSRNNHYFRGAPRLERFILHTYPDESKLKEALQRREITAAVDLKSEDVIQLASDKALTLNDIPLTSGVFAFFKTSSPILSDTNVRTALADAVNRQAILEMFKARYTPLKTPLLPNQIGYDRRFEQKTDIKQANKLLDSIGWKKLKTDYRTKAGTPLELTLVTINSPEYTQVAHMLEEQWAAVGVTIKSQFLTAEQLQQNALAAHSYDVLLYGISLGFDPDNYVYWHSSQARTGGLNLSEWRSSRADSSLEVARTRLEPILRTARYQTFLDEWHKSTPAVALYQPRLSYLYHQNATNILPRVIGDATDRYVDVQLWTVNTRRASKTP